MRNRIIYPALCLMLSVVSSNAQKLYTLEECRTLALENSAKMKNSRFEVEVAKQTSKEAFTNYFPNVSAVGAIFKSRLGGNIIVQRRYSRRKIIESNIEFTLIDTYKLAQ